MRPVSAFCVFWRYLKFLYPAGQPALDTVQFLNTNQPSQAWVLPLAIFLTDGTQDQTCGLLLQASRPGRLDQRKMPALRVINLCHSVQNHSTALPASGKAHQRAPVTSQFAFHSGFASEMATNDHLLLPVIKREVGILLLWLTTAGDIKGRDVAGGGESRGHHKHFGRDGISK